MNNSFAAIAVQKDQALEERIRLQRESSSIRYVFCPFADIRTDAIYNGIVPMGIITPISVQTQPVGSVYLQPILELDPNREAEFYAFDENGKRILDVGHVEIKPAVIVDELTSRYANWGAIQVVNLFSLSVQEYVELELNNLFVGEFFDEQQQKLMSRQHLTAQSYLEQFQRVEEALTLRQDGKSPKLLRVLNELRTSVIKTRNWARMEAETANTKLGTKDLPTFSPYHYRLFEFSGVTPRDQAVNEMAKDQASLNQQLPGLLETLAENGKGASGEEIAQGIVTGLAPFLEKLTSTVAKVLPTGKKPATPPADNQPNG